MFFQLIQEGWRAADGSGCVISIRINLSLLLHRRLGSLAFGLFISLTSPPLVSWRPLPPVFPLLPFSLLFGPFCLKIYPFLPPFSTCFCFRRRGLADGLSDLLLGPSPHWRSFLKQPTLFLQCFPNKGWSRALKKRKRHGLELRWQPKTYRVESWHCSFLAVWP